MKTIPLVLSFIMLLTAAFAVPEYTDCDCKWKVTPIEEYPFYSYTCGGPCGGSLTCDKCFHQYPGVQREYCLCAQAVQDCSCDAYRYRADEFDEWHWACKNDDECTSPPTCKVDPRPLVAGNVCKCTFSDPPPEY